MGIKKGPVLPFVLIVLIFCSLASAETTDVIVYQEEGKFCGWPANEGVWSWGDEILVGFNIGDYLYNSNGHSFDPDVQLSTVQARSVDGGLTWTLETPEVLSRNRKVTSLEQSLNLTDRNFAMKCRGRKHWYSYNRGKTWKGPFQLPLMGQISLDARTDYIVNSANEALFFIPVAKPDGLNNRAMVFSTTDAGKSFDFISYIAPCPPVGVGKGDYCTMPSTVKLSEGVYITALRQRRASQNNKKWIDIYKSEDNGKSWRFLTKAVDQNWNPASMIKLADGRICLTYGWRYSPEGIRAKISSDDGQTWGNEIILRDDGSTWDLGYPRSIQRSDGKVITIYYYSTDANPQQHIAATIWQP